MHDVNTHRFDMNDNGYKIAFSARRSGTSRDDASMVEFDTRFIERNASGKVISEVQVDNHICSEEELFSMHPPHVNQADKFDRLVASGGLRCLDTRNLNTTVFGSRENGGSRRYLRIDYRPCTPVILENNETGVCNVTNADRYDAKIEEIKKYAGY